MNSFLVVVPVMLVVFALGAYSAPEVVKTSIPRLTEVIELEEKKSLFSESRYSRINSRLMKYADSDDVDACINAALAWKLELDVKGKKRSDREDDIRDSIEYFVALDEVREELARGECSTKAQIILEKNDYHTEGRIYSANLKKDRYANTVRKVILDRARVCQDVYVEKVKNGYKNYWERNKDYVKAQNNLFFNFIDQVVDELKKGDKFTPYVTPKHMPKEKLGEILYNSLVAMTKVFNEEMGEERETVSLSSFQLDQIIVKYIVNGPEAIGRLGMEYFVSAAMDKKVAGEGAKFNWMDSPEFTRPMQAFLFEPVLENYAPQLRTSLVAYMKKNFA